MRRLITVFLLSTAMMTVGYAQDSTQVEEDYSMYADVELAGDAKRFCTSKVFDLSPNKLISIGYDYQSAYTLTLGSPSGGNSQVGNRFNHGLRLSANAPLVSKTNWLINVGMNYLESNYQLETQTENVLGRALAQDGLRSAGINFTIFKPLNEFNFIIMNGSLDLNGNYGWRNLQPLGYTKISAVALYGWKKHDRLMYGFGLARTYRVGELNYIPAILYNYTFPSRKWGVEAFLPARANIRRTFNPRMLGFFGYELEGNSYLIRQTSATAPVDLLPFELRRSELRIRFTVERSLKDFIWISAQAGFRYNWSFNADQREFFRGFGDDPYFFENNIGNAFYANVSINLVSP